MGDILNCQDITKKFGDFTALDNVSISIPEGCIFGLLGPNGAGKTTLLRIINQITYQDKGSVTFLNEQLQPHHIQDIGYLPEERGLYKNMKVGEQALYLARLKGLSKKEAKERLKYWFDRLDINDWWNKKIQELSKGMAQKVQFVVTILHNPKLLIFDEPFSGFDPINANRIKDEILHLKDNGATVIFSTHRMESVEELCDHIALINLSKKILDGSLSEVKQQFRTHTYEVALETSNKEQLQKELEEKFTVSEANFRSIGDALKLNITVEENTTANQLLGYLTTQGDVSHFVERIPSLNEIFIKSVESNS